MTRLEVFEMPPSKMSPPSWDTYRHTYGTSPRAWSSPQPVYWGVDPGTHTGVAAWDPIGRRFLGMGTYHPMEAMALLARLHDPATDVVFVEDPGKISHIWTVKGRQGSERKAKAIAQSVGGNKYLAQLILEHAQVTLGLVTIAVDPRRKGKKWPNEVEWMAQLVAYRLVGEDGLMAVAGKTSEHSRDASMYVAGETRSRAYWAQIEKK